MIVFAWYDAPMQKQLHIAVKTQDCDNALLYELSSPTESIWMVPGTVEA